VQRTQDGAIGLRIFESLVIAASATAHRNCSDLIACRLNGGFLLGEHCLYLR
jgi:hypothetical protein